MSAMVKNGFWVVAALAVIGIATYTIGENSAHSDDSKVMTRQEVEEIVKSVIRDNPQLIMESVNNYQQKQYEEQLVRAKDAVKGNADALENDPESPTVGNPNGDVTIVEFFDYNCGYCKKVFPSVQTLLNEDKNLKVVFKEFPILSPDSTLMAEAALAVYRLDKSKYLDFHGALMSSAGHKDEAAILELAKSQGIDADKLKEEMKKPEIATYLTKIKTLAQQLQIRGTPAFVIGGELIPGAVDVNTMREKIKAAREAKNKG